MTKILITDPRQDQFVVYNKNLSVAFYDGFKPKDEYKKTDEPSLYIMIRNLKDKLSVVRRKAIIHRIEGREVAETKIYETAYNKYLAAKNGETLDPNSLAEQNRKLKEELEKLKAAKNQKKAKPVIKLEETK